MEEVERVADLGRVKPRLFLMQSTFALHVEHEVTAVDKLYDEEQSMLSHAHTHAQRRIHTQPHTHTYTHGLALLN